MSFVRRGRPCGRLRRPIAALARIDGARPAAGRLLVLALGALLLADNAQPQPVRTGASAGVSPAWPDGGPTNPPQHPQN